MSFSVENSNLLDSNGKHEHSFSNAGPTNITDLSKLRAELTDEIDNRNSIHTKLVVVSEEVNQLHAHLQMQLNKKELNKKKVDCINDSCGQINQHGGQKCAKHPSKYDGPLKKQKSLNQQRLKELNDAKMRLTSLLNDDKMLCGTGKDCHLYFNDLLLQYNYLSKTELAREIKRLERLQFDLKSTANRLQWRLDCESIGFYQQMENYDKLQIELYYLQSIGNRFNKI